MEQESVRKTTKILLKQMIMRRVLLALLPCVAGGVYFFGWRSLFLVILAGVVGFIAETVFTRLRKEPVSEAVFVTTTIFALIMPPAVSLHVLIIGVVFAVMFTKEIFGGFGRNIFNPAMAGRCFVYICFPVAMTAMWSPPAEGFWGALDRWTTAADADAITSATPIADLKAGRIVLSSAPEAAEKIPSGIAEGESIEVKKIAMFKNLLLGRIGGTMGVTSALLILIGGVYLFVTKTASRSIIITLTVTYAVLNEVFYQLGVEPVPGAWPAVLGGGFLFGACFMATDPISCPRTEPAKIIYAIIIGVCTLVIRNFSIFNGGIMFSILIGNMFSPIIDYGIKSLRSAKKTKAKTQ